MAMLKDVADFFIALAQETAEMDMGDAMTHEAGSQGWMTSCD